MQSVAKNLTLTFRAEPESVTAARHALSDFAEDAGADRGKLEAVRLATSEALTNAVLHAYPEEPGQIYVTAAVVSGELWVLIGDDGHGLEPGTNRPGLGLGLGLISQVTDELAIVPRASGGTEVRMRFDLVSAQRAEASEADSPRSSRSSADGRSMSQMHASRMRGRQLYA
ncbi:MAG TPA: ATP-binding protein [Solirubrobacteraceae bacterium]